MSNNVKSKTKGNSLASIESQIFEKVVTFSDQMQSEMKQLFSIWGMTTLQHNALQVLYKSQYEGGEENGLSSSEVGKQLITRVPDVTRLLDRLADKGWLVRERDPNNRRVVRARLTDIGRELVESIRAPLAELETKRLAHMDEKDRKELLRLLKMASE